MIGRREMMAAMAGGLVTPRVALAADRRVFKSSIALEDNRLLVAVAMNGTGPYIFMIDTGTYVSLIRPDLAKQLKLPVTGYERTQGVGGKGKAFATYMARDFIIGGGIRQSSVLLSDAFEFGYQQDIYGALAAGIVTSVDTDVDFDASELRIYPDGRGDRPGYVAVDSEIPRAEQPDRGSRKMLVTVLVDGRPLRCVLDTGTPRNLLINQAAARRLGLWDGHDYAPSRIRGIGGTGPVARTVRIDSLALGDTRAARPLVTLLGNDAGDADGIVGLSFIRRFNLSIDTRGRKLWVQPSRQSVPVERYGLSGLWLEHNGAKVDVVAVGQGSPAANAGIAPGDRIAGEWSAVLRSIGGGPGSVAPLKVLRDGGMRDVPLTLAEYL